MTIDCTHIDPRELLPQQPPYVLVGQLVTYEENVAQSKFAITDQTYYVQDGYLPVSGIIENMAQTCALKIGYYHKYILHEPVLIGYLAGVKSFQLHQLPLVGQTLMTRIEILHEATPMSLVKAVVVLLDQTLVAEATLTIVETHESIINL